MEMVGGMLWVEEVFSAESRPILTEWSGDFQLPNWVNSVFVW